MHLHLHFCWEQYPSLAHRVNRTAIHYLNRSFLLKFDLSLTQKRVVGYAASLELLPNSDDDRAARARIESKKTLKDYTFTDRDSGRYL